MFITLKKQTLQSALANIHTFKFDKRLIHSNTNKNRVQLIFLGVKFVILCISKTETNSNNTSKYQ